MKAYALIRVDDTSDKFLCEVYLQKEDAIKRLQCLIAKDIKDGWRQHSLDSDEYASLDNEYITRNYLIERTKIKGRL